METFGGGGMVDFWRRWNRRSSRLDRLEAMRARLVDGIHRSGVKLSSEIGETAKRLNDLIAKQGDLLRNEHPAPLRGISYFRGFHSQGSS